ncbi:MAG: ATP-binding protein [Candidatus Woesearchaeota archaeon]
MRIFTNIFRKRTAKKARSTFQNLKLIDTTTGNYEDFYEKLSNKSLILLITGKRGSGKTALGMKLLEIANYTGKPCYAIGFQDSKLPRWIIKSKSLEEVTNNSVVLVDEGGIVFSSRESMGSSNKWLSKLMAIARHKNISLFLITQNSGMIDLNVLRLTDTIILKEPSLLQSTFERKAIKEKYEEVSKIFKKQDEKSSKFYIWDDDFEGLVKFDLPPFWNQSISKSFSKLKK